MRRATTLGMLILLSSCTAAPPDGGDVERGGQTETLIDGETVATAIARDDGYHVTVIERGEVVFRLDMARAPGGYELDAEMVGAAARRESSVVEMKPEAGAPKLEGINRIALFKLSRMREEVAAEEGRPVAQDRAGCNGIGGSCGPWGACCDTHDRCLADCWESATGGWCAAGCDAAVVACFASTTIPCGIGQIIGVGEGCKSECCDVGGNNICLADCSDATPGSWYKWGNHSCSANQLINFFCVADPGSCANYQCFKYDSRTGETTEITDGSFACDACGNDGYCSEPLYCTTCPDPIVDPQGHELGPRDPYCNPPVYTPGSAMDRLCGNNQRPLPPPHAIRLTCDAAYDDNGCHNYCVLESGLGGGAQVYCGPRPGTDACVPGIPGHAIPRGCDGAGHCVIEEWCDWSNAKNWRPGDWKFYACQVGPPDNLKPYCEGTPPTPPGTPPPPPPPPPPPGPTCGDGACAPGEEDCGTCPGDCPCPGGLECRDRQCVEPPPPEPYCGDGSCWPGVEDCGVCPGDCPCPGGLECRDRQCVEPPPPEPYCGDGSCWPGVEDCGVCPGDCPCPGGLECRDRQCVAPPPPEYCGDGACNNGEDCSSCPGDCGGCAVCYETCWSWVEDTCWYWIDVCDEWGYCWGYWEPYSCNGRWEPYECNPYSC